MTNLALLFFLARGNRTLGSELGSDRVLFNHSSRRSLVSGQQKKGLSRGEPETGLYFTTCSLFRYNLRTIKRGKERV